jgi:GNAT superfamily N-acetyltransferase
MDTHGMFQADVGYVFPSTTYHTNYITMPFFAQKDSMQAAVKQKLCEAFGYSETDLEYSWLTNALYVCCKEETFVGCVAVDRKLVWPYVSHLLVDPPFRKRGIGSMLMLEVAEPFVADMGFKKTRLWCEESLVSFYERLGYRRYHESEDVVKTFENSAQKDVVFMQK